MTNDSLTFTFYVEFWNVLQNRPTFLKEDFSFTVYFIKWKNDFLCDILKQHTKLLKFGKRNFLIWWLVQNVTKWLLCDHMTATKISLFIKYFQIACLNTCYLPTCLLAYLHTCILAYMHSFILAYIYTCILEYLHTCTLASLHTCILTYLPAYFHSCIHKVKNFSSN